MTSNLDCVGLAVPDREAMRQLVSSALDAAEFIGRRDDHRVFRWQDPSGARLVVTVGGNQIVDFLPSFAAEPGAYLAGVQAVNEDVAFADVLDGDGQLITRLAAEFEQRRMFPGAPAEGRGSVVALGVDVSVHASPEEFAVSDASLLNKDRDPGEPPAHFVENGWPWPPRLATESFISFGVFDPGESAHAYARLSGVVLEAGVRAVAATGQRFVAARVSCAGFEATVCLPAVGDGMAPAPGSVIAGTVFLVASLPGLELPLG